MFLIKIKAEIQPTEDKEKVESAIKNIFPDIELQEENGFIIGVSEDKSCLRRFKDLILVQRISKTAEDYLLKCIDGNKLIFNLNRLAAFSNTVNFSESAKPPIVVEIISDNIIECIRCSPV